MIAGERFLGAFRTIEAKLRKDAAAGPSMGFAELVRLNRPRNQVVSRCAEDLLEFAELRNAITHRRDDRLLAEPTDEAARGLEGIRDALISPPTLSSAIGIRTVAVCRPESTVREAVVTMKTGDFSQLPVYGARAFVGLLTAETVARWVAAEFEHNDGILEDTTVEEAMKWTEDVDNSHS